MNTYEEEIYTFVIKGDNYKSAVEISNLIPEINKRLAIEFWDIVVENIKTLLSKEYILDIDKSDGKGYLIIAKENWKKYYVQMTWLYRDNLHFGIQRDDKQDKNEAFEKHYETTMKKNEWWICYEDLNEDFSNYNVLQKTLPEIRNEFAQEKANHIVAFIKENESLIDKYNK